MLGKLIDGIKLRIYSWSPSDDAVIKERYKAVFGKYPDLINPKTFNEKITWIMANYRNPLYELCSDKIEVRGYVQSKGLEHILIKQYGIYDSIDKIDINSLPDSFVIKTTHSSGGVVVVSDKTSVDMDNMRTVLTKSMGHDLYSAGREWQYKRLVPRIVVEENIRPVDDDSLRDYKIFCFDGKPHFIYVATDIARGGDYAIDFYDTDWSHLGAKRVGHPHSKGVEKPENLKEMLEVAKILSKDFFHVRVDLYSVGGKIYFGELTFTTAAGLGRFTDDEWDYELGKYFRLPKLSTEMIAERKKK